MTRSEHILEGARCIRPELAQLLDPEEAAKVDAELAKMLAEASAGRIEDADKRALEILRRQDATLAWISQYLDDHCPPVEERAKATRGYAPLPGTGAPLSLGGRYRCPENDYVWYVRAVGTPVPLCPTHQIPLQPDP